MARLLLARVAVCAVTAAAAAAVPLPCSAPTIVGFYTPTCDAAGNLLPPNYFNHSLQAAVDASVAYYAKSPLDEHGLPSFTYATFLDGAYNPTSLDIIAGMQDGMVGERPGRAGLHWRRSM